MATARPGEWVETAPGMAEIDYDSMRLKVTTDRYTSTDWAGRERENIWMKVWQMVGREDDVAQPGDWFEHRILDQTYIIARGNDNVVRGFVNACTHRGNALCQGKGNTQRFTCPYHIWSFDLEGTLRGVSRPDLCGPLDKDSLGLVQVPVDTFAGFIFLNPDPNAVPLAEFLTPDVIRLMEPYHLEQMSTVLNVREALECNWKVVVDAFQEGYHITGVHPELLAVIVIDPTTSRFKFMGDHTVACAPFDVAHAGNGPEEQIAGIHALPGTFPGVAGILPQFDALVDQYRDADGTITFPAGVTGRILLQQATRQTLTSYNFDVTGLTDAQMTDNHGWMIFPNFFMTVRAGEATVIRMTPHPDGNPNRCIWHITSYMYLPEEFRDAFTAEAVEVTEQGTYPYFLALQQDYDQMQRQQTGLRNRLLTHMTLVHEELNVANFHMRVDKYVSGKA